mmetsp:Transcript_11890/g.25731  ORF Transcript_11890/g.25731 Transcript_11890/m.25731 type:complete len:306 (+) Transcript_11890:296-1213(+)
MSEEATSFLILPAKCMHLCAQLHRRFQCISLRRQLLSIQDAAEVGDLRLADTSVLVTGWDTSTPGALSALILFLGPGSPGSLREKFGPGAVLGPFAQSQLPFLFIARPYFINDKTSPSMVSASVKEPAAAAALRSVEAASGALASLPAQTQTLSCCSKAAAGLTAEQLTKPAFTSLRSDHPRFTSSIQPRRKPHLGLVRLDITRSAASAPASGALLVTIQRRQDMVAQKAQLESARPATDGAAQVGRSFERPTERLAASQKELRRPVEFQFKSAKWVSAMQPFVNLGADQQHTFHFGSPPWYCQI